jgi:nicotinamide mononucleotide transporter
MGEQLWADLRATTGLEVAAVLLGIVYVVLIVRRNRLGWIAGAASSIIYVWLAASAKLPMQSALQGYYVIMSVYGWYSWTRNQAEQAGRIHHWPWFKHLAAAAVIVAATALSARWLSTGTQAAWPWLDSFSTCVSLLATWLVARNVLENWLYWICADAVMVYLFSQQGHPFTAMLFAIYLTIAAFGYRRWLQQYRQQTS